MMAFILKGFSLMAIRRVNSILRMHISAKKYEREKVNLVLKIL